MSPIRRIILRGDHACYQRRDGRFPYLEDAAAAGATGVLIWFWGEAFRAVADDVLACCRDHGLELHLGVGIGAYAVCDGRDPRDPAVRREITDHLDRTLDRYAPAGVELQTGEYDRVEFKGPDASAASHARRVCETLNPFIGHLLARRPGLWVRSELNAEFCPSEQHAEVARLLDPRCTVEWSRFTGPFRGPDCHERGRRLLLLDRRFSWFLKLLYRRERFWHELAPEETPEQLRAWIEHWRGWVAQLAGLERGTLTICAVDDAYPSLPRHLVAAAVALARDPDLPTATIIDRHLSC